ncbi:hypothetical protein, partial [Nocardioides lentus]|uniref:hypothetical protein n=1 Tax=Nocardioides lentus TaxID=338077 RepID=UPI0031CE1C6E
MAVEEAPQAFVAAPAPVPGYVKPRFLERSWPQEAAVLLVEAPGAVGKSSAAAAIAHELHWPLVLAERAQVGSYSLSGLIQDSLGFHSNYMASIATGTSGIVVDSLDEALFRAGTDNFLAFVDNVQKVAGGSSRSVGQPPSIILFSRSEAAELIKYSFADAHVPLAEVELSFFDKNAAEEFIECYLRQRFDETGRAEYNVFRASPVPFGRMRDRRIKQVAALLTRDESIDVSGNWDQVKDFLGYAPVLTALAESLAVSNPAALKNVTFNARSQTDLISEIVTSVLIREQGKFAKSMQAKLTALSSIDSTEVSFDALYTIEEQCARLLAAVESIGLTHTSPVTLPSEIRSIYDEAAAA